MSLQATINATLFARTLRLMTDAYVECALWSSEPDPSTDEWSGATLADEAFDAMEADCRAFLAAHWDDVADDPEQAGHDFWLTRNGHGAGFWDGDWPDDVGERLTAASKAYGARDLYVGDDGEIYIS